VVKRSRYQAGQVIIRENDLGETAYIIEQGQVEVSKELDGQSVHLAYLGAGETFGEMSMIDEKPRSATVTAVVETVVSEILRDDFLNIFETNRKIALTLLKVLFERLREANSTILQLRKSNPRQGPLSNEALAVVPAGDGPTITLEGATPRAAAALPTSPFQITRFPFRVGRESEDPLVYNDLMLPDSAPLQISRHHLAFIVDEGRVGVLDRGSSLGSWVDGRHLGGPSGLSGPLFFAASEGLVVLGNRDSPFRYRVSLRP
jgi:CRP-like cAMP-binding protein